VEVGGPSGRPSNGAAGRLALLALVTAILVVLAGLFASPASATTTLHPQTRVAAIAEPSGQLVGPHATVLPGEGRERAPDYDSPATGSSVAAEEGATAADNVAVIGRQPDTAVAQDWPGHEVLNLPNGEWSIEANDKWVASVAERGMDVYTASPLTYENLWDEAAMRETVYARELRMFQSDEFGYTWDGDYLRAP
jgi:hypothetical protein